MLDAVQNTLPSGNGSATDPYSSSKLLISNLNYRYQLATVSWCNMNDVLLAASDSISLMRGASGDSIFCRM